MIDYFNLTNNDKNFQIFYGVGSGVWQTWQKPRGCTFIEMFLIGGGAGGSSGQTAATSTRTGGGGGGGSAIASGVFFANFLPDTLYVLVGMGGFGQTQTTTSTSGSLSYVSVQPSTGSAANLVLINGTSLPTATNGQTAGTGGTVFVQTSALLSYLGVITAVAGPNGANGGTNSGGGDAVALATNILTGGAGGGSIRSLGNQPFDGGGLQGSGFVPTIAGGSNGADGTSMPYYNLPSNQTMTNAMVFVGGLGGGSSHVSNGGKGGNGSYGCGGGGGGGSILGGDGGRGGDGLVIITCW